MKLHHFVPTLCLLALLAMDGCEREQRAAEAPAAALAVAH